MCPVTGARLVSASYTLVNADEALVGTVIGDRYNVRDILGQGSTGTVFGTIHAHFDRAGAMKVLRPRFTSMERLQRVFHTDSRAALTVAHPSLCEVYDVGTLPDGAPFFVMEKLEGETLSSRLGRERFSTAAAVDLLMQLLSAMETVHARELLFRDLRPQNIFLTQRRGCRPVLKVLDFGLSRLIPLENVQGQWDALRAVASPADCTGALSIPYYLSPERARSEQAVEPASDLFVAAVILYEALTAQKPFNGPTWNALVAHIVQGQPVPLNVLRPDVPDELSALVMRALSSNPRARPGSARELQEELRAVFEGPRRGSTSMRTAAVSISESGARTSPRADRDRDLFDDETRTDQKQLDVTLSANVAQLGIVVDEASADHPVRTVRPPPSMPDADGIDVHVEHEEPATSRGDDLSAALAAVKQRRADEDEETATMPLTPEVRASIERFTRRGAAEPPVPPAPTAPSSTPVPAPPASAFEDATRPPPTRRLTKPPR
jgi:serine/threonine-protein kinase